MFGLRSAVDQSVPAILVGDVIRLRQVLVNLTGNAVKFSTAGDTVSLQRFRPGGAEVDHVVLEFSVADTGIGIAPEHQKKLFQPFSQADVSTTREFGGTGLGLIISKEIVHLMDGEIWVKSEKGVGSTFTFTVCLEKPTHAVARSRADACPDDDTVDECMLCKLTRNKNTSG